MDPEKLIIFVKSPRIGLVKTRLAASIGAEAACDAYALLVETLLNRLSGLHNVELRFTPDDAGSEVQNWLRPGWTMKPQGDGDLGARLRAAFVEGFNLGSRRILVIGSDCPEVGEQDIREAWGALQGSDLVLGPSEDGGYWLIGLGKMQTELFESIAWSTALVRQQTLEQASRLGLSQQLLRVLADVDTEADWNRFRSQKPLSQPQPSRSNNIACDSN